MRALLNSRMITLLVAVGLCTAASNSWAQTQTAQSAMFSTQASGNYVITGNEVWNYNKVTAATYFNNVWDGNPPTGPVVSCSNAPSNTGRGCNPAYQPAQPATTAPDPNPNKLTPHVANNSCNFWAGTALTLIPGPNTTYTQDDTVTVSGLTPSSGQAGAWKFTWTYTYNITFSQGAGPFPPQTAWDLQSSDTTKAEVTVTGFFAGESTQKKSAPSPGNPWTFKTSFTMTDDLGGSRLVNPVAHILDSNASEICTLAINTTVPPFATDNYFYAKNAGSNGNSNQLVDNGTVLDIENGSVCSPGNNCDNFAGNNTTLGEKADITSTNPSSCSISQAGNYTLQVTGTLKGVSGASSLPVSVSSSLCIQAESCTLPCQ